ncbi:MAG: holo-ACP synthase [Nanoarchaeota archaeon]|nr:holo-ACP synthase [Nanoarchaeota archaeon]
MAIIGIGVDIEEISRFKDKPYEDNKSFYEKIFTSAEIEYCMKKGNPYPSFAVRFSAKEATVKALNKEIDMKSVEVIKEGELPKLKVIGEDGIMHLSLAHTKNYATAVVVVEE